MARRPATMIALRSHLGISRYMPSRDALLRADMLMHMVSDVVMPRGPRSLAEPEVSLARGAVRRGGPDHSRGLRGPSTPNAASQRLKGMSEHAATCCWFMAAAQ